MGWGPRISVVALACVLLGLPAGAEAATLAGSVSGQSGLLPAQSLAFAVVTVLDPQTRATVESTFSDGAGAYSVTVPDGSYAVVVDPGPSTLYGDVEYESRILDDVDLTSARTLDVVLGPSPYSPVMSFPTYDPASNPSRGGLDVHPFGVTAGTDGSVYLTGGVYVAHDSRYSNVGVAKLDAAGRYLASFGAFGAPASQAGSLFDPLQVVLGPDADLFVVDAVYNRVQHFAADGHYLGHIGSPGSGDGELFEPEGIALSAEGELFVLDVGHYRVQVFDAATGAYLRQFGSRGTNEDQLANPLALAVDGRGQVYVADQGGFVAGQRPFVSKFDSNGHFLGTVSASGESSPQISGPLALAVGPSDDLYVLDGYGQSVKRFDANGTFLGSFRTWSGGGEPFPGYEGLSVDSHGVVYVSAQGARRVDEWWEGPRVADHTPPTVVCGTADGRWHDLNVGIDCTARDDYPGLADTADVRFTLHTTVPIGAEDDDAPTESRQVCDRDGNCTTAGPIGGNEIDRALPRLTIEQAPNGSGGWFTGLPAVATAQATDVALASLTCTVDGHPSDVVPTAVPGGLSLELDLVAEGRHTVACDARDVARHKTTSGAQVLIDLGAPNSPTPVADRAPDYAPGGGWYKDLVTVAFLPNGDPALADGSVGSGVTAGPSPQRFDTSGAHVASASVTDLAGNASAPASLSLQVDADPPSSVLTCPVDPTLGSVASASWQDADAESGLAGSPTGSVPLGTGVLGVHEAVHAASDHVGHTASSRCDYRVVAVFRLVGGIKDPPKLNSGKGAHAAPDVTFALGGDAGLAIFAPGYPKQQPIACADGTPVGPATSAPADGPLGYDARRDTYTFHWAPGSVPAGTCLALRVGLADGSVHPIWFRF